MKTTNFFFSVLVVALLGTTTINSQVTQPTNNVTNSSSYVGTSNNFDVIFRRQAVPAGLISVNSVSLGLNSNVTPNSVSIGLSAGQFVQAASTNQNVFIGMNAGRGQSASIPNRASNNVFVGSGCGQNNSTGTQNTTLGNGAGDAITSGSRNTFLGHGAGSNVSGGSGNIFIGHKTGFGQGDMSNKLYIDYTGTDSPLIWGDFATDQLKFNGKVGIGGNSTTGFGNYPTTAGGVNVSGYNLFVTGGILTEEVRVNLRGTNGQWADYVFNKDYNLKPLSEVETFIKENGHLPNVPSAAQVKEEGIELGNMAKIQQEKIEELTLYIIELNKKLEAQQKQIDVLLQNK